MAGPFWYDRLKTGKEYKMDTELYGQLHEKLTEYSEIPLAEFEKLIRIAKLCHLKKDDFFVRAGEKPDSFGFVISGILRLYYDDDGGNEFIKTFCPENSFAASYSALLQDQKSRLSVQAMEDSVLMVINFKEYSELLNNHICWQILSRRLAEELFIKKEQKESQFLLDSAETRYLNFLKEYPNLEKRIKQYHIAAYLGITPVALSRIRAKLERKAGADE